MKFYTIFFILSIAGIELSAANKLTLPTTTCKRNESNYSNCLKLAIVEAWPRFAKGLPEFEFPSFEPYHVKYLRTVFNRGILNTDSNLTDIVVTGMGNVHISSANAYFLRDVFHLEIDIKYPMVQTSANCEMLGYIDQLKLYGKGVLNTTSDSNVSWRFKGRVINDTWIVKHPRVTLSFNKIVFSVKGFFNDDEGLNNLFSMFLNEHYPMLYRLASKEILESLSDMLGTGFNLLISKVSFSDIFPV